jgi:hypothetical protein
MLSGLRRKPLPPFRGSTPASQPASGVGTRVGTRWERIASSRGLSCPLVSSQNPLSAGNSAWHRQCRTGRAAFYGTEGHRFESCRARSVGPARPACKGATKRATAREDSSPRGLRRAVGSSRRSSARRSPSGREGDRLHDPPARGADAAGRRHRAVRGGDAGAAARRERGGQQGRGHAPELRGRQFERP